MSTHPDQQEQITQTAKYPANVFEKIAPEQIAQIAGAALEKLGYDPLAHDDAHQTIIVPLALNGLTPEAVLKLGNPFMTNTDYTQVNTRLERELTNYNDLGAGNLRVARVLKNELVNVMFNGRELCGILLENTGVSLNRLAEFGVINYDIEPQHLSYIAADIIEGLNYAHSRGFLHGDIKPENVTALPDENTGMLRFKIVDFEGARRVPFSMSLPIMYTPQYGPPEAILMKLGQDLLNQKKTNHDTVTFFSAKTGTQTEILDQLGLASLSGIEAFLGSSDAARIDMHSLACTLYSCLVGFDKEEFFEDHQGNPVRYHLAPQQRLAKNEKVPKTLYEVLDKACSFYPADRYQSLDEFLEALSESTR